MYMEARGPKFKKNLVYNGTQYTQRLDKFYYKNLSDGTEGLGWIQSQFEVPRAF